ncbi:MAG TPA: PQQ-dependent sugar dehydrogenase [Gemmatimonadaceae bacterium]|nr:PQQ-dependent sugar dehydrogenase [Gemmatimonadaceae bacterium]
MKIARYALLATILGCGDRSATIWARGESGFTPSGTIRLEPVGSGLRRPVYVTAPMGDARLFVVEQAGVIRVVKDGAVLPRPFLDIVSLVHSDAEQGLLSMAFHPDFNSNGYFFVYFLDRTRHIRIERFRVSPDPDVADAESRRTLLSIDKPGWEHNGGLVKFGSDGMLYIGTGDGGNTRKLSRNAQDPRSLLGKILRLDVDDEAGYTIPAGNAFRTPEGGRPEIWARGLRNPWRFAFDSATGAAYVADVGQYHREEVNVIASDRGGANFGWNMMEAGACYEAFGKARVGTMYWKLTRVFGRIPLCGTSGLVLPAVEYAHSVKGCAVIGGAVYRGRRVPVLAGHYMFSDFCGQWLRTFRYANGSAGEKREWKVGDIGQVVSFGEDGAGEMYIIADKGVFRITGLAK